MKNFPAANYHLQLPFNFCFEPISVSSRARVDVVRCMWHAKLNLA